MKTIKLNLYTYNELNEEAKKKAREWYAQYVYDYDWYENTYQEAENIGIKIKSFDLDRKQCDIKLLDTAEAIAKNIIAKYNGMYDIYKTADAFLKEYTKTQDESKKDAFVEQFETDIAEDYRALLQSEFDDIGSEENIADTIEMNEFTFTEDGEHYN